MTSHGKLRCFHSSPLSRTSHSFSYIISGRGQFFNDIIIMKKLNGLGKRMYQISGLYSFSIDTNAQTPTQTDMRANTGAPLPPPSRRSDILGFNEDYILS